jgi:hypothetical protein
MAVSPKQSDRVTIFVDVKQGQWYILVVYARRSSGKRMPSAPNSRGDLIEFQKEKSDRHFEANSGTSERVTLYMFVNEN